MPEFGPIPSEGRLFICLKTLAALQLRNEQCCKSCVDLSCRKFCAHYFGLLGSDMPGVTNGEKWTSRDSRISDFDAYSSEMTPQKRFDGKSSTGSQYSNGYNTGCYEHTYPIS
ncbi:hypothetical protein AVEN_47429-1 [Araneus ventricosus]|uniref:Uncharacterized protein n=1 Tax=Araneus ventricosus TaxID=182803 RepID=A0A4Y2RE35_ARAVE|nr:hypothetical protein AVEN_47429-1 [Araneus ventricosus]